MMKNSILQDFAVYIWLSGVPAKTGKVIFFEWADLLCGLVI